MNRGKLYFLVIATMLEIKVSRRSTCGFILSVLVVPVSWQSKLQKNVSLSSSEAEYIALSEAVKEVMFVI